MVLNMIAQAGAESGPVHVFKPSHHASFQSSSALGAQLLQQGQLVEALRARGIGPEQLLPLSLHHAGCPAACP